MIYILLLIIFFVITPLAVNRGVFKRIFVIVVLLEALKYIFLFTFMKGLRDQCNETVCFILVVFTFITMLPEIAIGHTHDEITMGMRIAGLIGGVIWNLVPAYIICLFLPEKRVESEVNNNPSASI